MKNAIIVLAALASLVLTGCATSSASRQASATSAIVSTADAPRFEHQSEVVHTESATTFLGLVE